MTWTRPGADLLKLYYLIRDLIVSLAAFGGAFLWLISPAVNFLTAFGCGLVGTLFFAIKGRDVDDPRRNPSGL